MNYGQEASLDLIRLKKYLTDNKNGPTLAHGRKRKATIAFVWDNLRNLNQNERHKLRGGVNLVGDLVRFPNLYYSPKGLSNIRTKEKPDRPVGLVMHGRRTLSPTRASRLILSRRGRIETHSVA